MRLEASPAGSALPAVPPKSNKRSDSRSGQQAAVHAGPLRCEPLQSGAAPLLPPPPPAPEWMQPPLGPFSTVSCIAASQGQGQRGGHNFIQPQHPALARCGLGHNGRLVAAS